MKNQLKFRAGFLVVLSVLFFTSCFQNLNAQNNKKSKLRLKAQFIKIIDGNTFIDIKATSKIKKQNIKVSNIDLIVYNEINEEKIKLGETKTNTDGETAFNLNNFNTITSDSTDTYTIVIKFKGNDLYKKALKRIHFKNATIQANLITKDSINYITANLKDIATDTPIADVSLDVQVQRLFRPLPIGKEFHYTDDDGTILVPIEEKIPGVDGNLTFEVVLNDSDEYGTVKALVKTSIGTPIVDESTFDQRTMWSPRNKTPLFLLIFPNILIIGIWSILIYLLINLIKITKS